MRMRYMLVMVAFAIAAVLTIATSSRPFEDRVAQAVALQHFDTTACPISEDAIRKADVETLVFCEELGLIAYDASRRYGKTAHRVFAVYRREDVFGSILDRYGHAVVPVVAYFVEHGSTEMRLKQTLADMAERIRKGEMPDFALAEITPEQYGLIAIHEINRRGHEILAEFEIVKNEARRKHVTRSIYGAKNVLLGGVTNVETVLVRGERLPTWSETAAAALDVAILTAGVGAVGGAVKGVRAAKATRAATAAARIKAAGVGAVRAVAVVGKGAAVASPVAFAYAAVAHPDLVASAGGWVAGQAGLPEWSGMFAVYFVGVSFVLVLLRFVLRPVIALAGYSLRMRYVL